MNKHQLILWDADCEFPNGIDLYECVTAETVPYLLAHSTNPNIIGSWAEPANAASHVEKVIRNFTEFLKFSFGPGDVRVIVCSVADGLALCMDTKNPIVFYPAMEMEMDFIEALLIRGANLHVHDRLTKEMEECFAVLHRTEGIASVADLNRLRQETADFFDSTAIRWGRHRSQFASPEGDEMAVA